MKLQNDYKIVYERVVGGKRHLYAGKNAIPAEDDVEVKFDSLTEDQVKAFRLIYEAGEGFRGSAEVVPTDADEAFALTDGTKAILAGDDYVVTEAKAEEPVVKNAAKRAKKVEVEEVKEEPVAEVIAD